MRVGVIDYGVGNFSSVMRALEELKVTAVLITDISNIGTVDRLILPGVGSFSDCARLLNEGGWNAALYNEVQIAGKPLLGICLGMQLLATNGMEGTENSKISGVSGLNFIPGSVENLQKLGCKLRVPHVGWNDVRSRVEKNSLFNGIPDGTDFYFVHSYAFVPNDPSHIIATVIYDITITAAVRSGNVWGTQFHPEKSSRGGLKLLHNFIENSTC